MRTLQNGGAHENKTPNDIFGFLTFYTYNTAVYIFPVRFAFPLAQYTTFYNPVVKQVQRIMLIGQLLLTVTWTNTFIKFVVRQQQNIVPDNLVII